MESVASLYINWHTETRHVASLQHTTHYMKVLYLDCFAGISGDMFVGAMLDLGLELAILQRELRKLHIGGYRLEAQQVDKRGLRATQFKVLLQSGNDEHLADQIDDHPHSHPHRALTEIGRAHV